jgi:hypothetical protein
MSSEIVSGQAIYNMSKEEVCVLRGGSFLVPLKIEQFMIVLEKDWVP